MYNKVKKQLKLYFFKGKKIKIYIFNKLSKLKNNLNK